jgi:ATP-dependent DNA helicase PIF1
MFLTGNAGTGKSTVVREFCQSAKDLAVVAPTGVAALNIGGQTIHSFFRLGFGIQDPSELKGIKGPQAKVIAAAKTILIDEISMVRSDLLQAIDARLRFSGVKTEPFGGKQVIMVGDFAQLPPVVKNDEVQYLNDVYSGPYAFDSPCWNNLTPHTLNQVMRTSDLQFLSALNFIRQADPQGLDIINDRVQKPPDNAVKLTPTNAAANAINEARLESVAPDLSNDLPPEIHDLAVEVGNNSENVCCPPKNWPGTVWGDQELSHVPDQLMPVLRLASVLHIDCHTHVGCGTFRLV